MKREVKIGLFAVIMIGCAWAGIRFLSGIDIFSRNEVYYAAYDQVNGVQTASPIMMKGLKIGTVTKVMFDPQYNEKVVLQFTIQRQYRIPNDSEAKIFSNGFMGSKAIEITYGTAQTYLQKGDTLRSSRDRDLMDMAGSELEFFKQKVSRITDDLSRTLTNINMLLESNTAQIGGTLTHLNSITDNVDRLILSERENLRQAMEGLSHFAQMLGKNAGRVDSVIGNMNQVTTQLAEADFAAQLTSTVTELRGVLAKINQGEGSVGKLLNDQQLYTSLTQASENLSLLLADLQQHPKRYVHFSLFGKSEAKEQAKAAKQAAKIAAKAERDSLRRL